MENRKQRMKLYPSIGIAALSSPLEVGAERAKDALKEMAELLQSCGCEVHNYGAVDSPEKAVSSGRQAVEEHIDAMVFIPVCWFEDYLVLDFIEECPTPLLLWSLPGMETGALCGTQQLTAYLKQLEVPFSTLFGKISDAECREKATVFIRGASLHSRLRRCRIGMAGHHVNGMTHTAPNEMMLKKTIGARIVWLDLPDILETAKNMPKEDALARWQTVKERAGCCNVSDADGLDSICVYLTLRDIVEKEGLTALAIGCYPHLMGRVCLAASLLADEGIPMACEGDVHGAIGQVILQLLTGQPTHNTDWLDPVDDESVVFTHCGSGSFTLAENPDEVKLGAVRLMNQGVCTLFTAKPGPVTLINITTHQDGYQCAVLEGEAISTEMVFPGNPVRVHFNRPVKDIMNWIHDSGLGHHWMIGYGHVAAELQTWTELAGKQLHQIRIQ